MADVIGNPAIRAEFDSRALLQGAKEAGIRLKTTFEESNRSIEAQQRQASKRIQGLISQINAEKPRKQMFELGQAVQKMGGLASLSEKQVERLRIQVERLSAAGAKAPKSLAGLVPAGGGAGTALATAAKTQITGTLAGQAGGLGSVLSAVGPAGLAAAAGIGAVALAAGAAAGAVADLASKAEGWSNVAEATGISVESVQKLQDFLEDAGFSADDLTAIMRKLQNEISTGGKEFEKFGIPLEKIRNLAPEDQLRAVAAAVAAIVDPTDRAAAATAFFGKSGAEHYAAIRGIAQGTYQQLSALSVQQVEDLKRLDDTLDQAGRAWTNFGKEATAALAEVYLAAIKVGTRLATEPIVPQGMPMSARFQGAAPEGTQINARPMSPEALARISNPATFLDTSPLSLGDDPAAAARRKEQAAAQKKAAEETAAGEKKLEAARMKAFEATQKVLAAESQLAVMRASDAEDLAQKLMKGRQPAETSFAGNLAGGQSPEQLEAASAASAKLYQSAIQLAQGAQAAGLGVDQIKAKLEGMGLSSEEAADIVDVHLKKQEEATQATTDWTSRIEDLAVRMHGLRGVFGVVGAAIVSFIGSLATLKKLGTGPTTKNAAGEEVAGSFSFGTLKSSLKTKEGKMGAGAAAAQGAAALGQALGGSNSVAGSTLGGAAKGAQMGMVAGPWGMLAGAVIGGAIGFFKSSKLKKEAKEAGEILGETVSIEQVKALKEQAKATGKTLKQLLEQQVKKEAEQISDRLGQDISVAQLKSLKAIAKKSGQTLDEFLSDFERQRNKKIEARQKVEQGLGQAKTSAESLMEKLSLGNISEGLRKALQTIIDKVGAALLKTGLGILDGRLKESKEFQQAQGLAGDVAGALGGMRQAGMVDTGLTAAAGAAASEIQQQAVAAALAAGMTPEEAAKAGSAAIAPLLREQLNASVQSGKELDENTKALLEEAKKNGIEILADPALEQLDVSRKQLDVLKDIAGKGGGTGKPIPAAGGLGPVRMPNLGGGLGPLIQTHANELALVLPAHLARRGGIISAAAGMMTNRRADDGEPREGRGVDLGGGDGGGGGAGGGGVGDGGSAAPTLEEVKAVVRAAMQTAAPVVNFSNVQNVEANPFQDAESRAEAMRMIMEEAARQLDGNAGRFAAAIDRRIRERL